MNTKSTSYKLIHLAFHCKCGDKYFLYPYRKKYSKKKRPNLPVKINTLRTLVIADESA